MATIRRKILSCAVVVVSAPKPVVTIVMRAFETGIFDVSAGIWRILALQSLLLLAEQPKIQLEVGNHILALKLNDYLITVIKTSNKRGRE